MMGVNEPGTDAELRRSWPVNPTGRAPRHPSVASPAYDGRHSRHEVRLTMPDRRTLLRQTADLAADFLEGVDRRPVRPAASHDELLESLGGPLPERGEA